MADLGEAFGYPYGAVIPGCDPVYEQTQKKPASKDIPSNNFFHQRYTQHESDIRKLVAHMYVLQQTIDSFQQKLQALEQRGVQSHESCGVNGSPCGLHRSVSMSFFDNISPNLVFMSIVAMFVVLILKF